MGLQARTLPSLLFLLQALAGPPGTSESSEFSLAGDYLLGGLFTLHANLKGPTHLKVLQVPKCEE